MLAASPVCTYQKVTCIYTGKHNQGVARLRQYVRAIQDAATTAGTNSSHATAEEKALALKQWVEKFCAPWPSELQPVILNNDGEHRMVAAGEIKANQVLLQVPKSLFMTADTAAASKYCGKLIKSEQLSEWQALVLHLLCERAAGGDSFWAPYIAVLGHQLHHPLLWTSNLQQQLVGSPMLRTLTDRLKQVQDDTDILIAAGANELEIAVQWQQQMQEPLVTFNSVCWAAAVILGRSFQLDVSEPDMSLEADMSYYGSWQPHGPAVLAMVPWADMLRHSSEADEGSMLAYDPEADAALMAAHRSYAPGEEVFDSHGPGLSHADLIMDHGCVGEGTSDNPRYDAVLTEHLKPKGSRNAALLEALTGLTGGPPALALTPYGPDLTGMAALRAGLGTDAEVVKAGWRTGSKGADVELCARVMGRLSTPSSVATERRVLEVVVATVDACLGAYPSSKEDDEQELMRLQQQIAKVKQQQQQQGLNTSSDTSPDGLDELGRLQLRVGVLRALVSEKTALLGCKEAVLGWQQQIEQLAAAAGTASAVNSQQLASIYESVSDSDEGF